MAKSQGFIGRNRHFVIRDPAADAIWGMARAIEEELKRLPAESRPKEVWVDFETPLPSAPSAESDQTPAQGV